MASLSAVRVLLVDDHFLVRAGLRAVLGSTAGLEIVGEAGSGEEAITLLEECRPDVVVMDLDMPGQGGLAATRTITARDVHPAVLILTVRPEEDAVIDALRSGAAGYLTKDVAPNELVNAIHAAAAGDIYVQPRVGFILARALRPSPPPAADRTRTEYDALSLREQTVLRLIAEGYSGPEIAGSLGITAKTVDTYRHRIQGKIGIAHRKDYIRLALSLGLLTK